MNFTAQENVPEQQQQKKGRKPQGDEVCQPEGIVFPQKSNNVQNHFAGFRNYTQKEVLHLINIKLFLVFFLLGTLDNVKRYRINHN